MHAHFRFAEAKADVNLPCAVRLIRKRVSVSFLLQFYRIGRSFNTGLLHHFSNRLHLRARNASRPYTVA